MTGNDKLNQLKDIIANMDADIYIARKDYETINSWLEFDDVKSILPFTFSDVQMAVDEAYEDPIIKKMINDGIGV